MKRKHLIGAIAILAAVGVAVWWTFLRPSKPQDTEQEVESLLPDRTPPATDEARPLILSPSIALHQDGQEHTVEFRVRSIGLSLSDQGGVAEVHLMDGPGALSSVGEGNAATVMVGVSKVLADQFKTRTGRDLDRYLHHKVVRVRGTIRREKMKEAWRRAVLRAKNCKS